MSKEWIKQPGPNPRINCVDPEGKIRSVGYGSNLNTDIVRELANGKIVVTEERRDQGWMTLEEAYSKDSRDDVRADGYREYLAWEKRASTGALPRQTVAGANRPTLVPFPREALPEIAIARQDGRTGDENPHNYVPTTLGQSKPSKARAAG